MSSLTFANYVDVIKPTIAGFDREFFKKILGNTHFHIIKFI